MLIFEFLAVALLSFVAGFLLMWILSRRQNSALQQVWQDPGVQALFKNLAADAFQSSSGSLVELAKSQLNQEAQLQKKEIEMLVKPLSDSVQNYKKELADAEAQRNKEYGSLDRLLKTVVESNQQLRLETTNLVHALKRPTVRGRWGEVQLRRVVELSGLSKHCDFTEQLSVDSEEGRLRPDLIVNLPNKRQIVVDSKAVLHGYLEAESATDDHSRKAALNRHAAALKTRIQELSRKSYWEQFRQAPEFVVLFIPGEAFFSAALEELPDLVETGFEQRVVLATPTTLMALLRSVAYGWRQEQLAENARRISEQASRIYQGLSTWTSHLSTLGLSLDRASKAYNQAVGSLERTVLPPVRRLKEYGVSSKDELTNLENVDTALRGLAKPEPTDLGGES